MKNEVIIIKKQAGQSGDDGNNEVRNKRINFFVSPSELEKLNKFYSSSGQNSFAGFCREKVLAKPGSQKTKKDLIIGFAQILFHLEKIGTNVNQIAKIVNSKKADYPKLFDELKNTLEEIKEIRSKVRK